MYFATGDNSSIVPTKYIKILEMKRDYYSSEKIVWQSLLKSLTQQVAKETELVKYNTMKLRNEVLISENS